VSSFLTRSLDISHFMRHAACTSRLFVQGLSHSYVSVVLTLGRTNYALHRFFFFFVFSS
jgi:hypothetical protein